MSRRSKATGRVKIWNTFFKLAWEEAKSLYEISLGKKSSKSFNPLGGTLPDKEFHTLATLVLCNLAIEARANHLIDELEENGKITKDIAEAARWLPTKQKWFLLPRLARKRKTVEADKLPHQAIAEICNQRNNLIHVKYDRLLKRKLPAPSETLNLFKNFVKAMENMNVVLGRIRKERKKVMEIGEF